MNIKTITTTLALSFLTSVSFADGHENIDLNHYMAILHNHGVDLSFEKDDSTFECVYDDKRTLTTLEDSVSYTPNIRSNLVILVSELHQRFNAVPLDIVMAYPTDVILASLDELRTSGIHLNQPEWLISQKDLILVNPLTQHIFDEKTSMCKFGEIIGPSGKKIKIDENRVTEFMNNIYQ